MIRLDVYMDANAQMIKIKHHFTLKELQEDKK